MIAKNFFEILENSLKNTCLFLGNLENNKQTKENMLKNASVLPRAN